MIADARTFRTGTGDEGIVLIIVSNCAAVSAVADARQLLGMVPDLIHEIEYKVPREPKTRDFIAYPLEGEGQCHIPQWRVAVKCGRYPSGFR